jgi:hypothetical protein
MLEFERGSIRSHSVEESLRKRLWTYSKTNYGMEYLVLQNTDKYVCTVRTLNIGYHNNFSISMHFTLHHLSQRVQTRSGAHPAPMQ